ncbi:MAG: hypothetical protein AB8H86_30250 [Polyangiales bacterium]
MASEVAARILEEGLVSRQELSEALADTSSTRCIVARLVERGVSADELLALFDEFGPPVGPVALAGAPANLVDQLPAGMAQSFFALPVAKAKDFVIVAMADPSHQHAIDELARALDKTVRARPARVDDLRIALARAYPALVSEADEEVLDAADLLETDDALRAGPPSEALLLTSVKAEDAPPAAAASHEEAAAVPLTRPKVTPKVAPKRTSRPAKTFRRPVEQLEVVKENSWADLDRESRPHHVAEPAVELGPLLAAIRDATTRDNVIVATAEAGSRFARSAVVLTLRRGVLRGAEARGEGVSTDAIRNLWIPSTSPSMFRMVVDVKDIYRGPFGGSAADHLYRAAIGSRGGNVEIHPVDVQGTVVAVLCADDPTPDPTVSLGVIAHAMGEALARLVKG